MGRWSALVLLVNAFWMPAYSQEPPIETDRPDQTEATSITPLGHLQVEHGVAYEREGGTTLVAHPSTLFRFGVSEFFEVRSVFEPVSMAADGAPTVRGVLPMEFGFKTALWQSTDGESALSLILHLQIPHLASSAFRTSRVVPLARLTAATPLGETWRFGANAGVEWDGGGGPASAIYTAAVGAGLSERVGGYGEVYGFVPVDGAPADHRLNGGVTWLANDDLQLDASVGRGMTTSPAPWFVGVGVSYRLKMME